MIDRYICCLFLVVVKLLFIRSCIGFVMFVCVVFVGLLCSAYVRVLFFVLCSFFLLFLFECRL